MTQPSGVAVRSWSWYREAAGSVADLGVLVPIAVALVVGNGLSATAVLLPAGLAYLLVAVVYRVPVAVQPLKAFGAVAIAAGAGPDVIAAGAVLLGAVFLLLGLTGWLDRVARVFPLPVVRGVQAAVGLTFFLVAWRLVVNTPETFQGGPAVPVALGLAVALLMLLLLRPTAVLPLVVVAIGVAVARGGFAVGPAPLPLPRLDGAAFLTAAPLLVLPQLPLTFANSCLAPADAARVYFGPGRVTPSRLAITLGVADVATGLVAGMPVCHGAGGMSAHHAAGARTARAPLLIGAGLVVVALGFGSGLALALTAFPLPVLAALLGFAGIAHLRLLRDLRGREWLLAGVIGALGLINLAVAVVIGLLAHWGFRRWS